MLTASTRRGTPCRRTRPARWRRRRRRQRTTRDRGSAAVAALASASPATAPALPRPRVPIWGGDRINGDAGRQARYAAGEVSTIRGGMLAVPPTPGMRPWRDPAYGSWCRGPRHVRRERGGSDAGLPTQLRTGARSPCPRDRAAGARRFDPYGGGVRRTASVAIPNSVRSPPLQNDGPSPRRWTSSRADWQRGDAPTAVARTVRRALQLESKPAGAGNRRRGLESIECCVQTRPDADRSAVPRRRRLRRPCRAHRYPTVGERACRCMRPPARVPTTPAATSRCAGQCGAFAASNSGSR